MRSLRQGHAATGFAPDDAHAVWRRVRTSSPARHRAVDIPSVSRRFVVVVFRFLAKISVQAKLVCDRFDGGPYSGYQQSDA